MENNFLYGRGVEVKKGENTVNEVLLHESLMSLEPPASFQPCLFGFPYAQTIDVLTLQT